MAKINHINYLDVVDDVWSAAKEKGIMHINSQESYFDGNFFKINDNELINFGTCGYMGFEKHPAAIESAKHYLEKYGTQLSMSRAYMRPPYIQKLENLMSQIFDGHKVITFSSTSNAHISVIPVVVKSNHLIILDQQVHFSVQFPCKHTRLQGTTVTMVKHSDYQQLEEMVVENYNKFEKIWYMADGVYSMHGDLPDTNALQRLIDKYPKLHLYFDDAHGMSWDGKNGAGYIYNKMGVNEQIILISTLAKGFGSVGGTAIFADPEMYRKTDIFGGPLSYSHPLTPANVGAAIELANIHLSPDIYVYQKELRELKEYLDLQLKERNLPNISSPDSPIYYIGCGLNKSTRNLVHRIFKEGIYVNTATFPVVPNDKSGLRFTLTRHNTKEDIDKLVNALDYHLPKAINEENDDIVRVYEDFGVNYDRNDIRTYKSNEDNNLIIEKFKSIKDIDSVIWDSAFIDRGNFTYDGMKVMEEIFSNNPEPENNWSFHYITIKDRNNRLICATFFTGAIYKDDLLTLENVSKKIEEVRKNDPYYLCSKTLAMGSLFSEGEFLYIDKNNPFWKEAINELFNYAQSEKSRIDASVLLFRDFKEGHFLHNILESQGYAKIRMPNSNVVTNPKWDNYDEFLNLIKSRNNKRNVKRYVLNRENEFEISIKQELTPAEAKYYYKLFLNVKESNFSFNFFKFPEKVTKQVSEAKDYEFVELKLKGSSKPVASVWCFVGNKFYSPLIMGLDYDYLESHHIYKQAIFQCVKRANQLSKSPVYFGFSADYEKQKYGAVSEPTCAYIKVDDMYNREVIESISNV